MLDHKIGELNNLLRDTANRYRGTGQLRSRLAGVVRPLCEQITLLEKSIAQFQRLVVDQEIKAVNLEQLLEHHKADVKKLWSDRTTNLECIGVLERRIVQLESDNEDLKNELIEEY